jgi:hypothetical protein
MTDQPTTPQQEEHTPQSYVVVKFAELGSVVFNAQINASPLQLLALAAWMEVKAKNMLLIEEQRKAEAEAQHGLAMPKLMLPNQQ